MSRSISSPLDDEETRRLVDGLPQELRTERARPLAALPDALAAGEKVEAIAGAYSLSPGILVLTGTRLLFLYEEGRLRHKVTWGVVHRDDARGCRQNEDGSLSILCFETDPVRFTGVLPPAAGEAIARALGPTPLDASRHADLGDASQQTRDAISARVPDDDVILAAEGDEDGIVALTNTVIAWAREYMGDIDAGTYARGDSTESTLPKNLHELLYDAYETIGEWDELLEVTASSPLDSAKLYKASALAGKGLSDAALVAYDDAIRSNKIDVEVRHEARYEKAALLVELGQLARARRELARLYADVPTFSDELSLLESVKLPVVPREREPIPEEVRHAVWRRDQGRCVQCGSQESLEFDHVIPLSRGGANTERNLQLLCESCNRSKGAII